jgi:hypothetical protein
VFELYTYILKNGLFCLLQRTEISRKKNVGIWLTRVQVYMGYRSQIVCVS